MLVRGSSAALGGARPGPGSGVRDGPKPAPDSPAAMPRAASGSILWVRAAFDPRQRSLISSRDDSAYDPQRRTAAPAGTYACTQAEAQGAADGRDAGRGAG